MIAFSERYPKRYFDVAIAEQHAVTFAAGMSPRDAIFQACLLRFRPIMMTTMAALFGALPLAFSSGDGAELRQPLGITIAGGHHNRAETQQTGLEYRIARAHAAVTFGL